MCLSRDTVLSDCQIATQRFVHALFTAEFDSVKFDGCSAQHNMTLCAELLNKTGRPAVVENCHVASVPARPVDECGCPDFHLYRCVAETTIRPSRYPRVAFSDPIDMRHCVGYALASQDLDRHSEHVRLVYGERSDGCSIR